LQATKTAESETTDERELVYFSRIITAPQAPKTFQMTFMASFYLSSLLHIKYFFPIIMKKSLDFCLLFFPLGKTLIEILKRE
jgi:hypothetical protein